MDHRREQVEALLDDKPELEDGLRSVLAVDADRESWAFEDVPLDSGAFGEVVSRGIVEERDEGYHVSDRAAVATALDGAEATEQSLVDSTPRFPGSVRALVPRMDRRVAALVAVALALVVLVRVVPYSSIFRGEYVVLPSNDPWAYRWEIEQMVARTSGPWDGSILSELPSRTNQEPLLVVTLWWVAELLGGSDRTVGLVVAWYPVVAATVSGALVYLLGKNATGDWRVGVAAVSFLATLPLHALRTGLGMGDHHAFDYPWLVLTALALVLLVDRDVRSPRTWGVAGVLGIAIAGQVLAWNNAALLLVPLGLVVAVGATDALRAGRSPLESGLPVAGGVGFGAGLVVAAHLAFGWHTTVVVSLPVMLFAGVCLVVVAAEGLSRFGGSPGQFVALQGIAGAGVAAGVFALYPSFVAELARGLDRLFGTEGIAESAALFGGHFMWLIGPLVFFGFALLLAVLYMAWAGWRTYHEHDPALVVPTVYGWYFFGLTAIQIRFAGEFSPFAAVFAGLGFVHLASWVDLARVPRPFSTDARRPAGDGGPATTQRPTTASPPAGDRGPANSRRPADSQRPADGRRPTDGNPTVEWPQRRTAMYTAGLWLGVAGFGGVMSAIKHGQIQTSDGDFETAQWIAADSADRGLDYPDNYVLAPFGQVRMYNYFVSGESRDFLYARNNYSDFMSSTDPDSWYRTFEDRVGYVVLTPETGGGALDRRSTFVRLDTEHGTGGDDLDGMAHVRARYVSDDGDYEVYELVAGATLVGFTEEDSYIEVATEVEIDGETHSYRRGGVSDRTGWYKITVAYPGTYTVGERTARVPERVVREGGRVRVDE